MSARPRVGVYKLASCDGCQLTLLNCEDELLELAERVEFVHFAEALSRPDDGGPLDLCFIEGSVSTEEQREQLLALRARTKTLIAIGACASAGGIQTLRNWANHEDYLRIVYAQPKYIDTLARATPASEHTTVDFELRGCPIDKHQLLELISATLVGRKPAIADESVCLECKRQGNVCVMVTRDEPCLGPITHAGCGALCPSFARGCYGCFGPREQARVQHLAEHLHVVQGHSRQDLVHRLRGMAGWSPSMRSVSERYARPEEDGEDT